MAIVICEFLCSHNTLALAVATLHNAFVKVKGWGPVVLGNISIRGAMVRKNKRPLPVETMNRCESMRICTAASPRNQAWNEDRNRR
jgi:hypothetical protein